MGHNKVLNLEGTINPHINLQGELPKITMIENSIVGILHKHNKHDINMSLMSFVAWTQLFGRVSGVGHSITRRGHIEDMLIACPRSAQN